MNAANTLVGCSLKTQNDHMWLADLADFSEFIVDHGWLWTMADDESNG